MTQWLNKGKINKFIKMPLSDLSISVSLIPFKHGDSEMMVYIAGSSYLDKEME